LEKQIAEKKRLVEEEKRKAIEQERKDSER